PDHESDRGRLPARPRQNAPDAQEQRIPLEPAGVEIRSPLELVRSPGQLQFLLLSAAFGRPAVSADHLPGPGAAGPGGAGPWPVLPTPLLAPAAVRPLPGGGPDAFLSHVALAVAPGCGRHPVRGPGGRAPSAVASNGRHSQVGAAWADRPGTAFLVDISAPA